MEVAWRGDRRLRRGGPGARRGPGVAAQPAVAATTGARGRRRTVSVHSR